MLSTLNHPLHRVVFCSAAVGNGGKTDKYEWTQVLQELSVVVPVPEGSKSRDVVCDITKSRLRVGLKGQPLIVDVSPPPFVPCLFILVNNFYIGPTPCRRRESVRSLSCYFN